MKMTTEENNVNDVNGAGSHSGSPSSGRCPVGEQHRPGRQSATAQTSKKQRLHWNIKENKELMFCYFKSRHPSHRGYIKRFYELWQQRNNRPDISDQNLADRARLIQKKTHKYFTKIQLKEIKDLAEGKVSKPAENSPDNELEITTEEDASEITPTEPKHIEQAPQPISSSDLPDKVNKELFEKLKENYQQIQENDFQIPNMKRITSQFRFKEMVRKTNDAAEHITTNNITETMQLIKAVIITVANQMGYEVKDAKRSKPKTENIPPWKQRMNKTLEGKRRDLSHLTELKSKRLKNQKIIENLARKYTIRTDQIDEQIEILKQEVLALKNKMDRYSTRTEFYRQNKLFETNQKRFYEDLENKQKQTAKGKRSPDTKKVLEFWSNIWGNKEKHNDKAEWIDDVKNDTKDKPKQEDLKIKLEMLKSAIKKMKNWRAAGKDGVQGFWLKNLISLHPRLVDQLQEVLNGDIPQWMTSGKTSLIIKNPDQPEKVSNYRPITCLPTIWKLLTSIIADEVYKFLEANHLIPWQQKGNKRKSRGTKDQLLIDRLIASTAKKKRRNLRMVWIDYRKAYDSVPHSWIIECLKMFHIADNIIAFLELSMKSWQTLLVLDQEMVGFVIIKCGIFQGDSLSPLLFILCLIPLSHLLNESVFGFKIGKEIINHLLYMDDLKLYGKNDKEIDSLTNTVRIFSQDINMQFGFDKCAKVTINKGKLVEGKAVALPDGNEIKNLELEEQYKYLGLLESNEFEYKEIKTKAMTEYKRRIRVILRSKLHGRNMVEAINTYAVPILTYPAGIVKFTQEEKRKMDTMTRKHMTMNGFLHPRADVDRLYIPRKKGGRGLLSVEDALNKEENALPQYIKETSEPIWFKRYGKYTKKVFFCPKLNWDDFFIAGILHT